MLGFESLHRGLERKPGSFNIGWISRQNVQQWFQVKPPWCRAENRNNFKQCTASRNCYKKQGMETNAMSFFAKLTMQKGCLTLSIILLNIRLSRGIRKVRTVIRFAESFFTRGSSWESNKSKKLACLQKKLRVLHLEERPIGLILWRSPGRQEQSQSREKLSESDGKLGLQSNSYWNCGQRGNWLLELKQPFQVWIFTLPPAGLSLFKLKISDVDLAE